MAERTRFAAKAGDAFPIIGIGVLAAVVLPLLGGGLWMAAGPALGALAVYVALTRPKGTIVILDKQGLLDRRLGVPVIAWRHVAEIDRVTVFGIVYINVHLTPSGQSVVAFPRVRELTNPLRTMAGITPVHITASGLDGTPDEVYGAVRLAHALATRDGEPVKTPVALKPKAVSPKP